MSKPQNESLAKSRVLIAEKVRKLRTSRHWSQRELAAKLGLSQNRLSEIERGGGSFSAEQFLLILRLFNADVESFDIARKVGGEIQNALIRHGAKHLRQVSDAAVTDRYRNAADAVAAVLLDPYSERFVAALAPVLLRNCDDISLPTLQAQLVGAGRPNRLGWLAENTLEAIGTSPEASQGRWKRRAARARLVLTEFLAHLVPNPGSTQTPTRDALDRGIRTTKTLDRTWEAGSRISRKWHIATAVQVSDFVDALGQALEPN